MPEASFSLSDIVCLIKIIIIAKVLRKLLITKQILLPILSIILFYSFDITQILDQDFDGMNTVDVVESTNFQIRLFYIKFLLEKLFIVFLRLIQG